MKFFSQRLRHPNSQFPSAQLVLLHLTAWCMCCVVCVRVHACMHVCLLTVASTSRLRDILQQLLLLVLVPCYRRCHQMEVLPENEKVIKLTDDDEGWVDTHHGVAIEQISESVQEMTLDQSSNVPQMVIIVFCYYKSTYYFGMSQCVAHYVTCYVRPTLGGWW